jgi:CheY-like chemotaxis protein
VNAAASSTILVVEDNEDVRKLLRIFLEQQQYAVVEARNGEEAVQILQVVIPDLIFMDLNTPKMDGIRAVEEIRQIAHLQEVPIFVNSADGNRGIDFFLNIEKFGKGYIEYLTKPFDYDELPKMIRKILALRQTGLKNAA